MALANHQTLALCNANRNDYFFLNLCCPECNLVFNGKISVEQFLSRMHSDDLSHFTSAWEITFQFVKNMTTDELKNYSLIFECRMLDSNEEYRRIMFKYLIVSEDNWEKQEQVLLSLKPIDGGKADTPSRGVYILDIRTQKFIYVDKEYKITKRELEVIQYGQKGLTSDEIADVLGIKNSTVNNHRCNILHKYSVVNIGFAAMYLHDMGVI